METLEIQAAARDKQRKRDAKRLLRSGRIPGVLYGPKTEAIALELDQREFSTRVAGLEGYGLELVEQVPLDSILAPPKVVTKLR